MRSDYLFQPIPLRIDPGKIFSRLGRVAGKTEITESREREIIARIEEAEDALRPGCSARIYDIMHLDDTGFSYRKGDELQKIQTVSARSVLRGAKMVIIMGSTAYASIPVTPGKSMSESVIRDAVGSEYAESAMDWLVARIRQDIQREGFTIPRWRFSPGYGDLDLSVQTWFVPDSGLDRCGVTLTNEYIMIPEKSVTAYTGIIPIT